MLEAKVETQQATKLTQDLIDEIAAELIENEAFDDGMAALVQNITASNRPPDDVLEEVASYQYPAHNGTAPPGPPVRPVVEKETYLDAGGYLEGGTWCYYSYERWNVYNGQWYWEGIYAETSIPSSCGNCHNPWSVQWGSSVHATYDNLYEYPMIQHWTYCN